MPKRTTEIDKHPYVTATEAIEWDKEKQRMWIKACKDVENKFNPILESLAEAIFVIMTSVGK